jgi:DNA polymerase-3 subunit gamma/tau
MSIDSATVKLIETSDAIRAKYSNQARMVSLQLLIDALDIMNKCDVTYRTSNNKRLALEIPLIQICKLSGQMQLNTVIQPQVTTASVGEETKPSAASQIQPQPSAPVVATVTEPVVVIPEPVVAPTPVAAPSPAPAIVEDPINPVPASIIPAVKTEVENVSTPEAEKAPEHDLPVQSHHTSSISIKSVLKADQLAGSVKADQVKDRTGSFTFEQIEEAILRFAELKKEDSALFYSALTSYKTVLKEDNVLLFTVGNTVLEKELNERRNLLLDFLRDELKNDFITFQIAVTEQPAENKKYMTDRDKLDAMAAQNPNVNRLRDQLNLELDL